MQKTGNPPKKKQKRNSPRSGGRSPPVIRIVGFSRWAVWCACVISMRRRSMRVAMRWKSCVSERDFRPLVEKDGWKFQSLKRKRSDGSEIQQKSPFTKRWGLVNYSEGLMYEALFVFLMFLFFKYLAQVSSESIWCMYFLWRGKVGCLILVGLFEVHFRKI